MAEPRKIIFFQRQSPGDILTMSRALGDLKRTYPDWQIDVRSPEPAIWEHNPHLTPLTEGAPGVENYPISYDDIHKSGWDGLHFSDAYFSDMEKKLNADEKLVAKWGETHIVKTGLHPEIYISDQEKSWFNQVHCEYKWDGPYWVINAGRKPDNELKQYHRWQEVVDILNEFWQGKVQIVQMGHPDHIHPPLTGVFDLLGKTDGRQLIRLIYNAEGTIGPLSYQFVLSAAFDQPAVVVAAAKEGVRWHLYNHIRHITVNGCLACAMGDGCWKGGAKGGCIDLIDNVPRCFHLIEPYMIADAVKQYYKGGRLSVPAEEQWVREWITVAVASQKAGVSDSTIRNWIASGKLVAKKEKGRWLIDDSSVVKK